MKRLLLLFLFLPPSVYAQNLDPRILHRAPDTNVKSVAITTVLHGFYNKEVTDTIIRAGLKLVDKHIERNSPFTRSLTLDSMAYDGKGRLEFHLQRFLFSYSYDAEAKVYFYDEFQNSYKYQSDTNWICITSWNVSELVHTTWVNGNQAARLHGASTSSRKSEYVGDTCFSDAAIKNQKNQSASSKQDEFWDYEHAGYFARKIISKTATVDTITYYDKLKNKVFMIIEFYDRDHRNVKSEYYSLGSGNFPCSACV